METTRKNRNRGYKQLTVWNDAADFYVLTCRVFRKFPYELKRVASQQIASADSVHRNIAEGYGRRSIREYLQHLYVALGSLGESVSGLHVYRKADQLSQQEFDAMDALAYKLENGLSKLVESLERKDLAGDWIDSLIVKESNAVYETQHSNTPSLQHSNTPALQHSNTPSPRPTVAIIGASADRAKFSNKAIRAHLRAGYDVYPVNPKEQTIEGLKCYKSVLEIPVALDRISLYLPPAIGLKILDDIAQKGCKELWVNPGAESPEIIAKAQALGLNAIFACSYTDAMAH
jgi:four helix bundle protein